MKTNEKSSEVSRAALVLAWFMKFPWLEKYYDKQQIHKVNILSVNRDALSKNCGVRYNSSGDYIFRLIFDIYLLNKDGVLVGQVGKKTEIVSTPKWIFWGEIINTEHAVLFSETIDDALMRLDRDGRKGVQYIVSLVEENNNGKKNLLITCPPKGQTIIEALLDEMKKADQIIENELGAVTKK